MDKKKFPVKGKTVTMYLSGTENAPLIVLNTAVYGKLLLP